MYAGGPLPPPLGELRALFSVRRRRVGDPTPPFTTFDCLDDIEAWLTDPRPFDRHFHISAWRSAFLDLSHALTAVGTDLRALVPFEDLENTVKQLDDSLDDVPNPDAVAKALNAIAVCRAVAANGPARVAAFRDVVRAVSRVESSTVRVQRLFDLLVDVLRLGEFDTERTLSDCQHILAGARSLVHDSASAEHGGADDAKARVAAIYELLREVPHESVEVVWISYSPARVYGWKVDLGPVMFFNASAIRGLIDDDHFGLLPTELTEFHPHGFFDGDEVVLARVDLGRRKPGNTLQDAQQIADSAVILAQFRSGTGHWRPTGLHNAFTNGEHRGGTLGEARSYSPTDRYSFYQDGVGEELDDMGPALSAKLPSLLPDLKQLAKAAEWWNDARSADTMPRVFLDVRLLEFVSAHAGHSDWVRFTDATFKRGWIRNQLGRSLYRQIISMREAANDQASHEELDQLVGRMIKSHGRNRIEIRYRYILGVLPRILELIRPGSLESRRVRDLIRKTRNRRALLAAAAALETEWSHSLSRLERVRNALAHGGPAPDRTAESVASFADVLSSSAVSFLADAVLGDSDLQQLVAQYVAGTDIAWQRMRTSEDVEYGLFGEEAAEH